VGVTEGVDEGKEERVRIGFINSVQPDLPWVTSCSFYSNHHSHVCMLGLFTSINSWQLKAIPIQRKVKTLNKQGEIEEGEIFYNTTIFMFTTLLREKHYALFHQKL